jgi:oligopeptidase A
MRLVTTLAGVLWLGAAAAHGAPAPAPPDWGLTPLAMSDLCEQALRRAGTALETVATLPAQSRSFANTPEAIETALQDLEDASAPAVLMGSVSVSSAARSAGAQCQAGLDSFAEAVLARPDLYRALGEYAAQKEALSGERKLLLERELADWRSRGAGLDRESRLELRFVRERLAARQQVFSDDLEWPRAKLFFTPEELAGLPPSAWQAWPRQGRLVEVDAEPEAYRVFMASVRDVSARQRLEFLYRNRAAATNGPVLQEILALRGRAARLLGAGNYARLALAGGLVPAPGSCRGALEGLAKRLKPQAKAELSALTALLRQDSGPRSKAKLQRWDREFYISRQLGAARAEAPALPGEEVRDGVLLVVQKLFGLRISRAGAPAAWHPDAALYELRDAQSGELLGSFSLDLYARPGKAPRAGVFVLSAGRRGADGAFQPGVCALWDNWPRRVGLAEMEGLLHGLGHVLAALLPRPRYARFGGPGLPPEAAELPGLLLGRLAWQPEVAAAVSGRRWTPPMLEEARRRRAAGWPLAALDDTAFALADLDMHEASGGAGAALRRRLESPGLDPESRGTHPEDSARALVQNGAGAAARVLAALLAEEFWRRWGEEGLFNPEAARHLRETFLAAGAAQTAQAVRNYLGREPTWDAVPPALAWPAGAAQDAEAATSGPPWRRRLLR